MNGMCLRLRAVILIIIMTICVWFGSDFFFIMGCPTKSVAWAGPKNTGYRMGLWKYEQAECEKLKNMLNVKIKNQAKKYVCYAAGP